MRRLQRVSPGPSLAQCVRETLELIAVSDHAKPIYDRVASPIHALIEQPHKRSDCLNRDRPVRPFACFTIIRERRHDSTLRLVVNLPTPMPAKPGLLPTAHDWSFEPKWAASRDRPQRRPVTASAAVAGAHDRVRSARLGERPLTCGGGGTLPALERAEDRRRVAPDRLDGEPGVTPSPESEP